MDPKEKKELALIVGHVIDEKVTPRLEKLEAGQQKISHRLEVLETGQKKLSNQSMGIMEQVAKNSEDIEVIKEEITDMGYTVERVETRLDATLRRHDGLSIKTSQLNRRVLRLESKKS